MNATTVPGPFRTALLTESNPPAVKESPAMTTLAFEPPPTPALPLRPYQEQAIEAVNIAESRGVRRQLVVLPTGSGKTVVLAHLVNRRPGRALVLAHRDELITQSVQKLAMVAGTLDIGVVKAQRDEHDAAVVVGSMQTLANPKRLARMPRFSTVIVDEAHHAVSRSYMEIIEGLGCFREDGPLTVGFTATAGRSDKIGLGAAWEEITFQRGIIQMIAEGYLCDVKAIEIGSDIDLGRVATSAGDFTDESLGAELERAEVLDAAAKAYRQHAPGRRGVAFTPTIATAHILAGKLREQGFRAEAVSGETHIDERKAILRRLHTGETQIVSNAQILTEGYDEPAISCMLLCRPTKSKPAFAQMAGRILRPFMGKENALILDVAGASELGLATIADLAGLPPRTVKPGQSLMEASDEQVKITKRRTLVAATRTRHVELLRRSDLRWLPAEDGWVLPAGPDQAMIIVPADEELWNVWRSPKAGRPVLESGKPLTLDWARGVGEEVARAQGGILAMADAPWRKRPPSDAQAAQLRKIGYADKLDGLNRGGAADLMTSHYAGKDIRRLRKLAA
jgi:superfamily II DNA or RNA helicase